ncbi:hypothetical protein TD95_004909 [Thielaviopsis punctulata]|uniref:Deoxycytidylate deaminase n=1 Tax=Thielaviopsis punctulata TaxID=72032 RepID=A0A0F4ZF30_9PEZI|nr:hypothetical protein TD95_004909 [Thielaviopsis punctulata]
MLIGICGGICAGKNTVAQYLIAHHGFTRLAISPDVDMIAEEAETVFHTAIDLINYVTPRWQERWVTTDVTTAADLNALQVRPFFTLISIDAPVALRWRRHQARLAETTDLSALSSRAQSLDAFVQESDAQLYGATTDLQSLISRASMRLLNTSSSVANLYATLAKLNLTSADRLRPSWDLYFMSLAALAAQRSNCMKRRVGCVLVGREKRVVSTGYNGTPRGLQNCGDGGCPRCNTGGTGSGAALSTCLCLHAEENALLEAGRERIREGAVLYCDTCPCLTCSIKICQVGIKEVVYNQGYHMDQEAAAIFREAGVELRQFVPPPNGLIDLEKLELNF